MHSVRSDSSSDDPLLHPAVIAALGVWLLNDHVLKLVYPGWLTGKLSDAAGLIVFPVFISALLETLRPRARSLSAHHTLWIAIAVTALGFSAVKLWSPAALLYQWGLGFVQWPFHAAGALFAEQAIPLVQPVALAMDPTDLWTLPFALVPLLLVGSRGYALTEIRILPMCSAAPKRCRARGRSASV